MIDFFMAMNPPTITHQEHKVAIVNGKPVFYETPELKRARQKLIGHLCKYKPEDMEPYQKGVRLVTKWCFPQGEKQLKDCMTTVGFWKDDALVASEIVEKFWARIPGIYIKIEELP